MHIICEGCGTDLGNVKIVSFCKTAAPGGGQLLTVTVEAPGQAVHAERYPDGSWPLHCDGCHGSMSDAIGQAVATARGALRKVAK
jgi:hypothetical protein